MSDIFDLENIKELVDTEHPSAVIVADTNVLMDNPVFSKWQTHLADPVFVLSYSLIRDLVGVREKKPKSGDAEHEKSPDKAKAGEAVESWLGLSSEGDMSKGI